MDILRTIQKTKNPTAAFTLVEVMVATSIFIIVMIAALGSLLVASNYAKKARAVRAAMDNVNYAVETMSRTIRLGSHYDCSSVTQIGATGSSDCAGGSKLGLWAYGNTSSQVDTIFQKTPVGSINTLQKCTGISGCVDLTSPEVDVSMLRFYTRGSYSTDGVQPSVAIIIKGTVTVNGEATDFAIQTLASQRNAE